MRACEDEDAALSVLTAALCAADDLPAIRHAIVRRLPSGWSVTDIDPPDAAAMLLVAREDDDSGDRGFLLSEAPWGVLELHALRSETLVLLGRWRVRGPALEAGARAA